LTHGLNALYYRDKKVGLKLLHGKYKPSNKSLDDSGQNELTRGIIPRLVNDNIDEY
jgi:hypothetical protein